MPKDVIAESLQTSLAQSYKSLGLAMSQTSLCLKRFAEHMEAMEPNETLAYIQVPDMPLLGEAEDGTPAPQSGAKKINRAPKDPAAPKRPASAFISWQNSVRAKYKAENPELAYKEVQGIIAQAWAVTTDAEKKPFTDEVARKVIGYDKEKAAYDASDKPAIWAAELTKRGFPVSKSLKKVTESKKRPAEAIEVEEKKLKKTAKKTPSKQVIAEPDSSEVEEESGSEESGSEEEDELEEPAPVPAKKSKKAEKPAPVAPKKKKNKAE